MNGFFGEQGVSFFENVLTSTKTLISSSLWKEVNLRSLERWVDYFESDQEKVLCGFLLDSLVFRTGLQTKALLSNLVDKSIGQTLFRSEVCFEESISDILRKRFPGRDKEKIKIIPVIRDVDPPTKSGPLVARLYKKELGVNDKFMAWPWALEKLSDDTRLVIFIDDFVGTGDQFLEFLDKFLSADKMKKGVEYIYAPMGACKSGIENIKEIAGGVKVCQSEIIGDESKFFTGFAQRYKEFDSDFVVELKKVYFDFLGKVGHGNLKNKLGYGDLELTYAYAHGTPNATLPIFWAANENYQPIFSR